MNLPMRRATHLLVVLASVFYGAPSFAAFDNVSSILLGERAAGMGGAFTALTGDPSATPFYNPATTVLMGGSSLSTSVSVYNKYKTTIGEQGDPTEAPQQINRGFFRSLPSATASIMNFGSFALGLSILVPDYDSYSGQLKGSGDANSSLNYVDESLWVGPTFSARLNETDSVGVSLYYTSRNLSRTVFDRLPTGGGTGVTLTNEEKDLSTNSIVSIFGFFRELGPRWSMGISYRPPSLPISGEGSYYNSTIDTTPYTNTLINRSNLRAVSRIPAKLAIGFARDIRGESTFSFDFQFYEAQSYDDFPELASGSDHIEYRPFMNFALGYEKVINDFVKLRMGFYSNLSTHPAPRDDLTVRQGDDVDMLGFSANFVILTKDRTTFTFGGYYSGGDGVSTQYIGRAIRVVPKSEQIFTMLVATGFKF